MAAPQRHRLLQGYPMAPLLRPASDAPSVLRGLDGSTLKLLRSRAEVSTNTAGRYGREDLYFPYEEEDLKLLFLTRSLPRLQVERAVYQGIFGADLVEDFGGALAALCAAGVVSVDEAALRLTPRGCSSRTPSRGSWPGPRRGAAPSRLRGPHGEPAARRGPRPHGLSTADAAVGRSYLRTRSRWRLALEAQGIRRRVL